MRVSWIALAGVLLTAIAIQGQEPAPARLPDGSVSSPADSADEATRVRRPPPTVASSPTDAQTRRAIWTWRPFRRWLRRTSTDQEIDTIRAPESPIAGLSVATPTATESGAPPAGSDDSQRVADSAPNAGANNGATRPADAAPGAAGSQPVAANPVAVSILAGTGALGRLLGIDADTGVRLGGLWIGDAAGVLSGGQRPGTWGLNGLTIVDLHFDADKIFGWKGATFGTEFLQFTGSKVNELAGAFPAFNSLEVTPPLVRQELYQLWYRQALFDDKLIFRIGKSVPTFDFGNVVRPVPVNDPAAAIPAVSSLIFTPVYVNATMLGVIPGYYNSATGITVTVNPISSLYMNYGFYDGNIANPNPAKTQTGLEGPHFNGYYFHIGEIGYSWRLGPQRKPGNIGVGVWGQTGRLKSFDGGFQNGAAGTYLFGGQRLWFRNPGVDNSGVSGFYQWGTNNTDALLARQYYGGGLTAFGLVPGRPVDSFGAGIAWTALNRAPSLGFRSNQLMIEEYYQTMLFKGCFFQTSLTEIPNPGMSPKIPSAFTIDLRIIFLF
jgi:porin